MIEELEVLLLHLLNVLFFIFHFVLIVFNLTGWAYKKTRRWHLVCLMATAFSWFVLGIFNGWGYCFLTDWHYNIRHELDLVVDSSSYIHFLLKRLSIDFWSSKTTDILTVALFAAAIFLNLLYIYFDFRTSKKPSR